MAGTRKTWISKRWALLCATLSVSLCAPGLRTEIPAQRHHSSVQVLALAFPSPTILVNMGSQRLNHARQRACFDSPFLLAAVRGPVADRGYFARNVDRAPQLSLWAAEARTGRSPPIAIS